MTDNPATIEGIDWGRRKALSKRHIAQIRDVNILREKLDEATDNCITIETQLEFSDRDSKWRESAITALIYNKIEKKNLKSRLDELERASVPKHQISGPLTF